MDSERINQLLEKYWNCETSLEEEKELKEFFQQPDVPANMLETAALFRFFEKERSRTVQENFERDVTKRLHKRPAGRMISMNFQGIARIAAGIAVVVVATYFIRQEIRKQYPKEMQDTYTDPQMAFEETKKALMLISNSFGKAKKEAEKVNLLNEAEKKVQTKQTENKTNI
ncbi:MAG: hypothetical protein JST14_04355 [Bacteroidetes bacterium]|nr:hypothetical protein [Bacteroidota bacterium]